MESRPTQAVLLCAVIACAVAVYAACLWLSGIVGPHEWRALFRRS